MANLPYMDKHRGFPGRLPGTDFQFVLRRANKDATGQAGRCFLYASPLGPLWRRAFCARKP
jgi:hypothetical protein